MTTQVAGCAESRPGPFFSTGAMKRYPRRAIVSTKRGLSAESPNVFADLVDGFIEAIIEVDKGVVGPQFLLQLLPRDTLTWVFQQHRQDLKRLFLEFDLHSILTQFARSQVKFKKSSRTSFPIR